MRPQLSFEVPAEKIMKTVSTYRVGMFFIASLLTLGGCSDDVQTSSSSTGGEGGGGVSMALPAEGGVGDACAPNDGAALDLQIGVPVACDIASSGPQFRFYVYPGNTGSFSVGQSWAFDAATMGQMGSGTFYPDGIGGNPDSAQSGRISVTSVAMGTVDVNYEFVTSSGTKYAGSATLTVCPSMPMCG